MSRILDYSSKVMYPHANKGSLPFVYASVSPTIRENDKKFYGGYITPSFALGRSSAREENNRQLTQELWMTTQALLDEIGIVLPAI